jgi:hypothetical protein
MIVLEDSAIRAQFDPEHGLNMMSLIIDEIEVIDQKTKKGFLESSRGLGPIIGPHFYHRRSDTIPFLGDEVMQKLHQIINFRDDPEPFSHGIGRYVPWKIVSQDKKHFKAHLSSKDPILNLTLGDIEGFDFSLEFTAKVTERTLHISYNAKSSLEPVVVGLHTYYGIYPGMHQVELSGAPFYYDKLQKRAVPTEWLKDSRLFVPLDRALDFTFTPQLNKDGFGTVEVKNGVHTLTISAKADPDLSFQIYKDPASSFVCIEPIAAINPRIVTKKHALLEVKITM